MKHLNESWLHYRQQFLALLGRVQKQVKTYYNPHAAMLTGAILFVVWWVCTLFSFFGNRLSCRLIIVLLGLFLYSLLWKGGDPFFFTLYGSSFMRGVLLYGRHVEIVLCTSICLSMVFASFLVSLMILYVIEWADFTLFRGFRILVLPYIVVRAAIAYEGGTINSIYMERVPYFQETHLLITSGWAKSGWVAIVYYVCFLVLVLSNLGIMEKTRITDLKDSFLACLRAEEDKELKTHMLCLSLPLGDGHKNCSSLISTSSDEQLFDHHPVSSGSDKIADLSAQVEEACGRATSQGAFRLGCKTAASTVGLCCSPLASFSAEISTVSNNHQCI